MATRTEDSSVAPGAPDRVLQDNHQPLAGRVPGADAAWIAAIDQALAPRPEARPQTAAEWRARLSSAIAGVSGANPAAAERRGCSPVSDAPMQAEAVGLEPAQSIGEHTRTYPWDPASNGAMPGAVGSRAVRPRLPDAKPPAPAWAGSSFRPRRHPFAWLFLMLVW